MSMLCSMCGSEDLGESLVFCSDCEDMLEECDSHLRAVSSDTIEPQQPEDYNSEREYI